MLRPVRASATSINQDLAHYPIPSLRKIPRQMPYDGDTMPPQNGLAQITEADLAGDCLRLNRNFSILLGLIQPTTTTTTTTVSGGGGGGSGNFWTQNGVYLYPTNLSSMVLVGMPTTDLGVSSIVAMQSINVVTATLNASICGMFCAGGRAGFYSGRSGTGAFLPLCFDTSNTERVRILTTGQMLVGLTSTDLGLGNGAIVSNDALVSATASANASIASLAAIAGTYVSLASSRTGGGTHLPMAFFTSATEQMRLLTTGGLLVGLASSDIVLGSSGVIARNTLIAVVASANSPYCALSASAGSVQLVSGVSGAGSFVPLVFSVGGAEKARILTTGMTLIGRLVDDGTGALFQVNGAISAAGAIITTGSLEGDGLVINGHAGANGTFTGPFTTIIVDHGSVRSIA